MTTPMTASSLFGRVDLRRAVQDLSDLDFQQRVWIDGRPEPDGSYSTLDMCIHILYDDLCVIPDPKSRIGIAIYEEEAAPLLELDAALGPLIDELGDVTDAIYIAHPRWPTVARAAREVLVALRD